MYNGQPSQLAVLFSRQSLLTHPAWCASFHTNIFRQAFASQTFEVRTSLFIGFALLHL